MKKQKNSMMKKLALITGAAVLSGSMCLGSLSAASVTFAEEADTTVEDQTYGSADTTGKESGSADTTGAESGSADTGADEAADGTVSDSTASEDNTSDDAEADTGSEGSPADAEQDDNTTAEQNTDDGAGEDTSGTAENTAVQEAGDISGLQSMDNVKAAVSKGSLPYRAINGTTAWAENWEYLTNENLNRLTDVEEGEKPWFFAKPSFTFEERVTINGNVNIVLFDNCTLNFKKGVTIAEGSSLSLWVRDEGKGKVVATSGSNNLAAISVNEGSTLSLNGPAVTATTNTNDAAGIGSDSGKSAGNISIYRGTIEATSKKNAAGIGGGMGGSGGNIYIGGGTITATSKGEDGAGIGGGEGGSSGIIKITNGNIKATGSSHGAGIGGGKNGMGENITITGGTIDAKGGAYAAGIGAGGDSGADKIIISGGKVNAWGGTESAGIGSANKGHVNTIEITGGRVYAFGKKNAAGIGGGDGNESNGTYGTITISGEGTKVGAYGGAQAAGIGTGNDAKVNNGTINITDGAWVQAVGGSKSELFIDANDNVKRNWEEPGTHKYKEPYEEFYDGCESGAGIGGGDLTPGGTINISGKNTYVEAYGATDAAGIGSGDKAGSIGDITIIEAKVIARGGGMRDSYDAFPEGIRGSGGAGIGGGRQSGSGGNITIKGADVNARGSEYASGIGGGDEGGFNRIVISDDAVVTARGGKHGAGIGTGDVTDNGNKEAWKTGTIEITGKNTKVNAYGGEDGAAGIGGGDDGYGCEITIKDVGRFDGATGYVKATAAGRAAGIGGGPGKSFKSINLENAVVTATGGYGAGIGGGGGQLEKQDPSHVNGGDINIKDSAVVAASMFGGAGIGGGIFGRADNINISGGTVVANGGCMFSPEGLPAFTVSVMSNLMTLTSFENDLFHVNNAYGASGTLGGILASIAGTIVGEAFKGITKLFGVDTMPKIICYTGAGIGGGYKSAGGNITISDNAAVSASAGVLPPGMEKYDKNAYKDKSANIGRGKKYTGSEETKVVIYSGAAVTTAKVDLKAGPIVYQGRSVQTYEPVLSEVKSGFSDDPETMSRIDNFDYQLAVIQPGGIPVTFDSNGGPEVDDQVVGSGNPVAKPADPVREGFEFLGWYQIMDDGTESLYDFSKPVTAETNLKAHWRDLNKEFTINIDNYRESRIQANQAYSKEKKEIIIYEDPVVKLTGIVVTDDEGNEIEAVQSKTEDGIRYTFTMPYSNVHVKGVVAQKHKINIEEAFVGKIVTSYDEAVLDTVVSIVVTDRRLHDITVLDNKNESVEVRELAPNTYAFNMPDSEVLVFGDIYGADPYRIDVAEGAPETDFANLSNLARTVTLESDGSQYLLMEVSHYEEGDVPEADKKLISDKVADLGAGAGNWFDISLFICNSEDDSKTGPLPKPEKPIELKAQIPEDLRKEGRTFYLIGLKDGEAFCYGETTGTEFTWEADTFGTYLIAYKDAGQSSGTVTPASGRSGAASPANVTKVTGGNTVTTATSAKTGDKTHLPAFIAIAAAGAAGLVGAFVARRRKKD